MLAKESLKYRRYRQLISIALLSLSTLGCFHPPFNDFIKNRADITGLRSNKQLILNELAKQDIQYIKYGDTMTLLIPTDHYFVSGTADINEICYSGLENVVRLLLLYPKSHIYVAAFGDNIGTAHHQKRITQAQAQAMLTFLWASHIPAQYLHAKSYGDRFPIGDNDLIRGSAFNRRIEIQWMNIEEESRKIAADNTNMKS